MGHPSVDCSNVAEVGWVYQGGQDQLPSESANSDIAGVGISIGFSAAAYITFILVITYYFCDYVEPPFSNRVDHWCVKTVWRRQKSKGSRKWEPFLRKAMFIYSDTQLVMGLALLGSIFPQLYYGLESYYWQIAVYLAWFSSHVHLTTVTILRQYFRDHPPIRMWRATFMVLMAVMLSVALIPTGDTYWMVDNAGHFIGGVPALCHYHRLGHQGNFSLLNNSGLTMLISVLILFFGYVTRILKLSASASSFMRRWMREKPGSVLKRRLDVIHCHITDPGASKLWFVPYVALEICLVTGRASLDAYESMLWEIIWLLTALLWGSVHLFLGRTQNLWKIRWQTAIYEQIPHHEDDNDWTFAQVFEVILLFLPILHTGEAFFEHRREFKKVTLYNDATRNCSSVADTIPLSDLRRCRTRRDLEAGGNTDEAKEGITTVTGRSSASASASTAVATTPTTASNMTPTSARLQSRMTFSPHASPRRTPPPPSPPHEQDYYNLLSFRLLIALIFILSLGNILYTIGLSLLLDIDWAYIGVLCSCAFCVVEVMIWATGMVCWAHVKNSSDIQRARKRMVWRRLARGRWEKGRFWGMVGKGATWGVWIGMVAGAVAFM